jgi:hypothetical protein
LPDIESFPAPPLRSSTLVEKTVLDSYGNISKTDKNEDAYDRVRLEKPLRGGGQRVVALRGPNTKVITDTKKVEGKKTKHEREYKRDAKGRYRLVRETRDNGKQSKREEYRDGQMVKQTTLDAKGRTERDYDKGALTAMRKYEGHTYGYEYGAQRVVLNEAFHPLQGQQNGNRLAKDDSICDNPIVSPRF